MGAVDDGSSVSIMFFFRESFLAGGSMVDEEFVDWSSSSESILSFRLFGLDDSVVMVG